MLSRRAILAGTLAVLGQKPAFSANSLPPFRRGVSIHQMWNWGEAEAGGQGYRWPPFNTPQHRLMPETIENLTRVGFDFIRLTVDSGVFLHFSGARSDELLGRLVADVKSFLARGLGVVVDLHGNSQIAAFDPQKITASSTSPLFQAYEALLVSVARALAPLSKERLAFELMNEPQWGWDAASAGRWNNQQKQWVDAVRKVAPELRLVLTGARGGSLDGLLLVDASLYRDPRILWSFHYYEPMLLTHQGVKAENGEARLWRHFSGLPYPAVPEMFAPTWAMIRAGIEADTALTSAERARLLPEAEKALKSYLDSSPGRVRIAQDFDRLATWARTNGVAPEQMFMGEFGITRSYGPYRASPPGPLENWLSDVRKEAEKRAIGWAFWALSGYGGMSLIAADDRPDFDPATVRALGMNGAGTNRAGKSGHIPSEIVRK